jgi:hypothetical protein
MLIPPWPIRESSLYPANSLPIRGIQATLTNSVLPGGSVDYHLKVSGRVPTPRGADLDTVLAEEYALPRSRLTREVARIRRSLRLGGLGVMLAVLLALTLAGSVGAGNHLQFADAAGDHQVSPTNPNVYASDIRLVDVTSADNGDVKIAVTLADGPARLVDGDQVDVLIDINRDGTADATLTAWGNASGQPSFFYCTPGTCSVAPNGSARDTPTGTGIHVVEFNYLSTATSTFNFLVRASYPRTAATPFTDIAPNSGSYAFQTRADPDGDGVFGFADECPKTRATTRYDTNRNGCPGPFKFIRAREPHFRAAPSSSFMRVSGLRFTGLERAAQLQIAAGSRRERITANRFGVAPSRALNGVLPYGMVITVRITKVGFVGAYLKLVTDRRQGFRLLEKKCIAAVGSQSPVTCSGRLAGK